MNPLLCYTFLIFMSTVFLPNNKHFFKFLFIFLILSKYFLNIFSNPFTMLNKYTFKKTKM